jgi:hypothetical protein
MVMTKTTRRPRRKSCRGMLTIELIVAMAILVIAVLPMGYSLIEEARFLHANYQRAVAIEIVDGEMEILAAGEWRSFPEGTHAYPIHVAAATNLPPGQFQLTRTGNYLRLEWTPNHRIRQGTVVREVTVK